MVAVCRILAVAEVCSLVVQVVRCYDVSYVLCRTPTGRSVRVACNGSSLSVIAVIASLRKFIIYAITTPHLTEGMRLWARREVGR